MIQVINLCQKTVTSKDNKSFPVTFCYRQVENPDGTYTDVLTPGIDNDGKPTMYAKSIKVALSSALRKKLEAEGQYPYRVVLDSDLKCDDGSESYYITVDKKENGDIRLDKNGKKHCIVVIRKFASYEPLPHNAITFDDIDNIE